MSRLAKQAVVLSIARIANYGLMLLSPFILVRVLPIADYGHYREYLLYVTVLIGVSTFSINESMLYFIPAHPEHRWRVVRQTVQLVALSSVSVVALMVVADLLLHGALIGQFLLPLSIYVILHVNLDFWEWYWISSHRPAPVFAYTSGRLVARMLVVITAAALTHDVNVIIWGLMALELVRFVGSWIAWRRGAGVADREPVPHLRRDQIHFCLSSGFALLIATLSRNAGNLAVVKWLGVVPLALYTNGLYGEPVIVALRNSISSILLPEMVRRSATSRRDAAALWRSATVINCMALLPCAVLLVRFADPLVVRVFGPAYQGAAVVLQLYALVILRECFDMTLPLRAVKVTVPLVRSSVLGLVVNGVLLLLLLRTTGIRGAIIAMICAGFVELLYQCWCVSRVAGFDLQAMLPWRSALKVLGGAVLCGAVLSGNIWSAWPGFPGMILASAAYLSLYALFLWVMRVPELQLMRAWIRRRRAAD